ncbi:MAG: hypothetical protein KatS3mg115_1913 [Candidatus Poribacteria bacterium]|nr:MAG: hypothetical protein KatS3mg115_1913 [Candidatus Poribacteria bacterium]
MSVVEDARIAASIGVRDQGVTAMHDATECGLWGGLVEVAQASRVGMRIERDAVPIHPDALKICELFGIDPYSSISEGTLVLTCRPHRVEALLEALRSAGITAAIIGEVVPPRGGDHPPGRGGTSAAGSTREPIRSGTLSPRRWPRSVPRGLPQSALF